MSTHKTIDAFALAETMTERVRVWLDEGDFCWIDSSKGGLSARAEACQAVVHAAELSEAAEVLHSWFNEHLTRSPGVREPLAPLAADLLGAALNLVDWEALADEIRD